MTYLKAQWAYKFSCQHSLEEICDTFNASGPWTWQMRENYMYGSYLNSRPADGLHLRLHEYPQAFFKPDWSDQGFASLIQIESDCPFQKAEVDDLFHHLLGQIIATEIIEIEPYD